MPITKPVPTEYRGIRFRSKSEAMFALFLDLVNGPVREWVYEPCINSPFAFAIDFLVGWLDTDGETIDPVLQYIEYKPSRPTETYCRQRAEMWATLWHWGKEEDDWGDVAFMIKYGSIWSKRGSVYFDETDGGIEHSNYDWLQRYFDDVADYRFDLE